MEGLARDLVEVDDDDGFLSDLLPLVVGVFLGLFLIVVVESSRRANFSMSSFVKFVFIVLAMVVLSCFVLLCCFFMMGVVDGFLT